MKTYAVRISPRAKSQLRKYIEYLVKKIGNSQAASAVADDAAETIDVLSRLAEGEKLCDDEDLAKEGIHKIFFQKHNYVYLYSIESDEVHIHGVYHTLQDYENIFKDKC